MSALQALRMSVGQTWLFVTSGGKATVIEDLTGYRKHIDTLKSGAPVTGFNLPWPRYRSRLWGYLFGSAYDSTPTPLLVRGLLPLQFEGVVQPSALQSPTGTPSAAIDSSEAFFHPFAVTTILHLSLLGAQSGPTAGQEAHELDGLLKRPLSGNHLGQVRDGVPVSLLPMSADQDADGQPVSLNPAGGFVALSALHQTADPLPLAYRLASLYQKTAADKSKPMNTDQSAISVTDGRVGMLLPEDVGSLRLGCLHHNITALLAYMQNLAAVIGVQPTESGRWFQTRAALTLNYLYRRAPLPDINGIYKSRVAEMWIQHRGLVPVINQVNGQAQSPPPGLP